MLEYKISETIQDDAGRYTSVKVRYYEGEIDPKTGQYARSARTSEERLVPNKALTEAELLDSLNARCQAKYPKDERLAEQQTVDLATNIDPRYPIINEGKDVAPEGR